MTFLNNHQNDNVTFAIIPNAYAIMPEKLPAGLEQIDQLALIQEAYDRGCWLCAICAGPTILARIGCLDRREAVCYPGMEDKLVGANPRMDQSVVVDGHIITGRAAGAAFDFGLELVKALAGEKKAEEVRHAVHYRA